MTLKYFLTLGLLYSACDVSAFTFVSGPNEATLPVTSDNPKITFKWNGSAPTIKKKEEWLDGKYKKLSDEDFMAKVMEDAFGVWNDVKGSYLDMEFEKDTDASVDDSDEVNSIVVKKMQNLSSAAFAQPILSDDAKSIKDCDITVGDSSVDAESLAYVLAHEIGHCVGLGHNHTNRKALMGYTRNDYNLWLSADDKAGIIFLYLDPTYDSERKEFLACATLTGRAGSSQALLLLILLLPVFAVFSFSRSRVHSK